MAKRPNPGPTASGGTPALDDDLDTIAIPRATGDPAKGPDPSEVLKERPEDNTDAAK